MSEGLKPGYKQTDVGVIPEDWSVSQLSNMTSIVTGNTPPTSDPKNYGDEYLFVGPGDLGNEKYISRASKKLSKKGWALARKLPANSILFTCIGSTIGKSGIAAKNLATNQQINALITDPEHSSEFLYYALDAIAKRIRGSASEQAVPLISKTEFGKELVAHPCKVEQERIATILSDFDILISCLDQFIAKKRDIQQAAMQQLLTGQRRLPGFNKEWEVKRLGEVGAFLKGSGVTRDQSSSGRLPCVRYGEIYTSHHNIVRVFQSFISKEVANNATPLKMGDILFAGSGETKAEIGKCVAFIDNFEAYAGGDIVILRPINTDSTYLGYALNAQEICRQKASRGQGDAVVHISANALSTVEIKLPPKGEQTAIATILSDMDTELAALKNRRAKACDMKQGMMQELLTGRIRLS